MAQLNNIKSVSVPSIGKIPLSDDPGEFTPSGTKRDHKGGRQPQDGGFTSTSTPATLALNINLQGGISLADLNAIENEDITIRLADGHVHMMDQAWATDPSPIRNGVSSITFMSNTSEEIS